MTQAYTHTNQRIHRLVQHVRVVVDDASDAHTAHASGAQMQCSSHPRGARSNRSFQLLSCRALSRASVTSAAVLMKRKSRPPFGSKKTTP